MIELLSSLKTLGGMLGKGFVIEAFLEWKGDELIDGFKKILNNAGITPEDIREYVINNQALPIPPEAFVEMKGIEDYLETIEPERIFEWLAKARPDLANELMKLGDLGAEYVLKFKAFIIDSVKAADVPEEAERVTVEAHHDESPSKPIHISFAKGEDQPPLEAQEEAPPEKKTKKVTCEYCGFKRLGTPEEAEQWAQDPCPECGKS